MSQKLYKAIFEFMASIVIRSRGFAEGAGSR
jgi:hypothetical protein